MADTNRNGKLELEEIQEAYRRMNINPEAIEKTPYFRLTHDEYRFPMGDDLKKAIESYK